MYVAYIKINRVNIQYMNIYLFVMFSRIIILEFCIIRTYVNILMLSVLHILKYEQ